MSASELSLHGYFAEETVPRHPAFPSLWSPLLPESFFARDSSSHHESIRMVSLTEGGANADPGLRELQPGSFLDRFRIERQLGAGGFGTVYLASHVILKSSFAIKVLKPAFNKKHSMLSRLQREGKLAAMISHDNVVRVYDAVQHPDIAYLVMEYVENGSLSDLLKAERQLPVAEALRLGLGVARGLAAGLQAGVIHRDIKPANVLLGRDGVKITDFGLALLKSRSAEASRVGTPGYASPEQTNQGVVDHRADIFSLGVTLFEAITGLGPRKLGNSTTKAAAPDVATVAARLGPIDQDVAQLVGSMIAPEPAKRLGSYEHIERRLLELLSRS